MPDAVAELIHHQNILYYAKLLRSAPDMERRRVLLSLLADERARGKAKGWLPLFDRVDPPAAGCERARPSWDAPGPRAFPQFAPAAFDWRGFGPRCGQAGGLTNAANPA